MKEKKSLDLKAVGEKSKQLVEKNGRDGLIKLAKAVIVILTVLVLLFVAANRFGNITFSSIGDYFNGVLSGAKQGDGYPYYFESTTADDVKKINSDLLVLSSDSTFVLDATARKLSNIQHSYSAPLIDSCNGRAIMYDVGSVNYRVQSKTKVLYEGQTGQKIVTACVGKDGSVAISTRGESSASQLTVLNSNQKEVFKWDCAKENIISVDVSDNGKRAAVSVIGAENGELYSRVLMFDFKYKEPVYDINFSNQIVSSVEFVAGYKVVASGSNVFCFIDKKGTRSDVDVSLNTLSRISVGENNVTAAVFSKYGSSSAKILKVYNNDGKEQFSTDINMAVRDISCEGRYISVLCDHQLINYNRNGKLVGNCEISSDGISCFTDGNNIYVLTTSSINCFKTWGETIKEAETAAPSTAQSEGQTGEAQPSEQSSEQDASQAGETTTEPETTKKAKGEDFVKIDDGS